MTEQQLITTIVKSTFTKDALSRRINLLREYMEYRYFVSSTEPSFDDFVIEKSLDTPDSHEMSKWGARFFNSFGKDTLYTLIESLMRNLQQVPTITLYLPFEPDEATTQRLSEWMRTNVDESVIMDIRQNYALIMGCGIVWKGIYRELSLHYFLEKHREEILNLLSYYASKHANV